MRQRMRWAATIEVEDTAELVLTHANGARSVFYATLANSVNAPITVDIVAEKATLQLRGDLVITHDDGRVEVVEERRAELRRARLLGRLAPAVHRRLLRPAGPGGPVLDQP